MLPANRVIGHKEYGNTPPGGWAGRKSDPVYDMNWRRGRVAAFQPRTTIQEDDVPLNEADYVNIATRVWQFIPGGPQAGLQAQDRLKGVDETALLVRDLVRGLTGQVTTLAGQVAGYQEALRTVAAATGQTVDMAAIAAAAKAGAAAALAEGVDVDVTVGGSRA